MKKIVLGLSALCLLMACGSSEQPAVIKVSEETLMHEVRATPSPADGTDRKSTRLNSSHTDSSRMPSSA